MRDEAVLSPSTVRLMDVIRSECFVGREHRRSAVTLKYRWVPQLSPHSTPRL